MVILSRIKPTCKPIIAIAQTNHQEKWITRALMASLERTSQYGSDTIENNASKGL